MGPKATNIFAGGWTPQKAAKLNQTQLPEKTRCQVCHRIKTLNNFSNKQLADLRHCIAGPNGDKAKSAIAEIITCRTCTGGPVNELTCSVCGDVKGLDGFSKAQRKDPDAARCILCLHQQSEEGWAHADPNRQDSEEELSDDSTATNPYTSVSYHTDSHVHAASSALKEMNLSEHDKIHGKPAQPKALTIFTESDLLGSYSDEAFNAAPGSKYKEKEVSKENEWQTFASKSSKKKSVGYTGYDAKGSAHRQTRAPSTVFSEDSLDIATSAPSVPATKQKGSRSRFAKVPRGGKPRTPDNVVEQLKAAATGRTVSYDFESSDDEFGTM